MPTSSGGWYGKSVLKGFEMSVDSVTSSTTTVSVSPFLASYFDADDQSATSGALRRPEFVRAIHTLQDEMRSETLVGFLKHSQAMEGATNQKAVITAYNQVLIDLTQRRDEWQAFLRSCCAIDLFEQTGLESDEHSRRSQSARRRWQNELASDARLEAYQYESVLTAKLASLPVEQLKTELMTCANTCLEEFNRHCLAQLVRLVELEVFGIAQWFDGNCQYCFFRRQVRSSHVSTSFENHWDWDIERRVVTGKTTMHLYCHEHHLIDAQQCPPDAAGIPIPEKLDQLLAETPAWIFDYLKLITGTMIKENVVEEVESEETWQQVEEIPRMHFDPALVIGPFVLLAWGPRDEERLKLVPPRDGLGEMLANKYQLAAASAVAGVGGIVLWSGLHSSLLTLIGCAVVGTRWLHRWSHGSREDAAKGKHVGRGRCPDGERPHVLALSRDRHSRLRDRQNYLASFLANNRLNLRSDLLRNAYHLQATTQFLPTRGKAKMLLWIAQRAHAWIQRTGVNQLILLLMTLTLGFVSAVVWWRMNPSVFSFPSVTLPESLQEVVPRSFCRRTITHR